MKILLTTLNSKFTHSSLAIRYIKGYMKSFGYNIEIDEYTINNSVDFIQAQLFKKKCDVIAFSCYIWNYEMTLEIARNLRKVLPDLKIVFGGPEVSYDPVNILEEHDFVDYVIYGEGEESFKELYEYLCDHEGHKDLLNIKGIVHRVDGISIDNGERDLIKNLDDVPFPFENLDGLENRILYYESSRGCPFNCQYCLSSTIKGVRFFGIERVKKDLKFFIDNNVMQVKFVDRTFNANKEHALSVMKFCHENDNGYTNFHFEMTASLIDDETLEFIKNVRPGLFQFEIGVQSTNKDTIGEIKRNIAFEKVDKVCRQIVMNKNVHLHLDLIAGLPFEDFDSFMRSIDDVMAIRPEKLQLGFLKLLKGSGLRVNMDKYGYVYNEKAPYEVMANDYLSYEEMILLKDIEELVESYYNSGFFKFTLEYIFILFGNPSVFFCEFARYWDENQINHVSHKSDALFNILYDFMKNKCNFNMDFIGELLQFDMYRIGKRKIFPWFDENAYEKQKEKTHAFLQNEDNVQKFLPSYIGTPAKNIIKKVQIGCFNYDIIGNNGNDTFKVKKVYLFDYDMDNTIFDLSKFYDITTEFDALDIL